MFLRFWVNFLGLKSLKKIFLGLESLKNQLLGLKSQKNNSQWDPCWIYGGKNMRFLKKRSTKKFGRNEEKYYDFRHFLGKYRLKQ